MPNQEHPVNCVCVKEDRDGSRTCFPVGTMFSTPLPVAISTTTDGTKYSCTVSIPAGVVLTITTATNQGNEATGLEIATDSVPNGAPACVIPSMGTVSGLGLEFVGRQQIQFAVTHQGGAVNVTGSVSPANYEYQKIITTTSMELQTAESPETNLAVEPTETTSTIKTATKKRKLSNTDSTKDDVDATNDSQDHQQEKQESSQNNEDNNEDTQQTKRLSKRQRKKLAKQKAKELAEAVAFLNKHESKGVALSNNNNTKSTNKSINKSLTRERRLPSGVLVKDIIVGTGAPVKLGRKVSILYEGSFPNGKVFDRNKNRNSPLTFRQGTGQVIKGLEKGIEGMKLGGERELTIPPELGYGRKGSGNVVPPNSTLVFTVQLVGLGG